MYIDKLLIDKATLNFMFADTMNKRNEVIEDLKSLMYQQNRETIFVAGQQPEFVLLAESKVGQLIEDGLKRSDLRTELMRELNDEQLVEKALNRL